MSVYSEEVSRVETPEQITENGFEDVSLEDNILNIEENVYSATASTSSTSEEITVLPDGIYAFQLKGSNMFMKSENAYPESGDNMAMAQYSGNNVPYMRGAPVATFKITRRESSGTYIIRLMTDESLTIAFDGTNVVTKSISTIDSIVALRNTFYITKHSDGYSIRPYSSSDYISATSDHSGVTSGALSDNAKWYIRGYRTFIEEGVYALENLRNTGMWMDTYFNSYERNKNAQQYDYSSSPADSFSRGGLFKVTKTAVDGQYVIRLMTNNLLTWEVQSDNYVKSDYISYDEDEIELNQKYYIVFDNGGFIVVPCNNINKVISALEGSTASGSAGGDDARLRAVQRSEATNSARWKLHKYTGEDDGGANLIVPSAFGDTGAIVGSSYTVTPVIWHTDPNKNMYGITDNGNVSNVSIDTVNHTADIYVYNPGKLALEVNIRHLVLGIPVNDTWNYFNYNSVPKEGIYYLQNCYSKKYANVLGPSHDEGKIIHQWEYHTAPQARWQVEHVEGSGGYIRFKSLFSNKYMGVDPNNSSQIRQYTTTGENTLWRFELLDNYAVKIICKASESSGTVLATPADRDGNGEWLTQRAYTDDDNYSDEWIVSTNRYQFYIDHYYDIGYSVRFGEINPNVEELIASYQDYVSQIFAMEYDIEIRYTCQKYTSPADNCVISQFGSVNLDNLISNCPHPNDQPNNTDPLHTTRTAFFNSIDSGTYNRIVVVWTGHILYNNVPSAYFTNCSFIIMTPYHTTLEGQNFINKLPKEVYRNSKYSLMHELTHQFKADDHYCNKDGDPCSNKTCDICGEMELLSVRKCIMGERGDLSILDDSNVHCSECMSKIISYFSDYNI